MAEVKPLFIPLKTEYFDAFESGAKNTEWRKHGPRWNDDTCWPGRTVVLSCGYGKHRRLSGVVDYAMRVSRSEASEPAKQIYPDARFFHAITIKDVTPIKPRRGRKK